MNKKKIASKFLSFLDGFELFYKRINKKLNANKLSKKVELIVGKKVKVSQLLNLERLVSKTKSLLNKNIEIPNWLTADSLSKSIRLFIKSKFGVSSQHVEKKSITKRKKSSKIAMNMNVIDKITNLLISINKNIQNTNKLGKDLFGKVIETPTTLHRNFHEKVVNLSQVFKKKKRVKIIKVDKKSQTIGVAFYSDHFLTLARISINPSNEIVVRGVIEVPIPGHVIGDQLVEDTNELANITLDLFNLLNLNNSPLLVILSTSFFKVKTFFSSELKQISNTDDKVQSKSPYLPDDTFVEFFSMSKQSDENKLLRTIYVRRKLIESWTNMLEIVNVPIIGLTPAGPNIFDALTRKLTNEITILIDIEISSTSLLIGRKSANLNSHRLPYGCSLYISEKSDDLSDNYFIRVLASIELIMSEYDEKLPSTIFVMGQGLDNLLKKERALPKGFKRVSDLNLVNYSYTPKRMEIHELVSKSIDTTIETLSSIASSCL